MKAYEPNDFIKELGKKATNLGNKACPFCGARDFTTTDSVASILIGKDLHSVSIGPVIPSGMLICQKCGHVEFFALGVLGMLQKKEGE